MEPIDELRKRVAASSQSAVARELGVSRQFIGQILAADRPVSEDLAAKLGFRRVWQKAQYRPSEAV